MSEGFTSFFCSRCGTEIEATFDLIGQTTECPACGEKLTIPDNRPTEGDKIVRHAAGDDDPVLREASKRRTIRIDLGDF